MEGLRSLAQSIVGEVVSPAVFRLTYEVLTTMTPSPLKLAAAASWWYWPWGEHSVTRRSPFRKLKPETPPAPRKLHYQSHPFPFKTANSRKNHLWKRMLSDRGISSSSMPSTPCPTCLSRASSR